VRIGFAGTPGNAAATLEALFASRHEVVFVLTRPDAPSGRGRVMTESPVAKVAQQRGVPLVKADNVDGVVDLLAEVDCLVVVAFGVLLPQWVLDLPAHGALNVHYSLLPRWRGAAPVQHAIAAGDSVTGVSIFTLDAGLDTGPVIVQRPEPIRADDTAASLLARLTVLGIEALIDALQQLESGLAQLQPQPNVGVTVAPKITTATARIEWHHTADAVERMIRAVTPTPGAWTTCDGERLKVDPVRLRPDAQWLAPGTVHVVDATVLVGTASHPVELVRVQRAGRSMGPAAAWATSRHGNLE
jgi:methionyl-tRNA formyltransferase